MLFMISRPATANLMVDTFPCTNKIMSPALALINLQQLGSSAALNLCPNSTRQLKLGLPQSEDETTTLHFVRKLLASP